MILYFLLSAALVAADQITKLLTVKNIPLNGDGGVILKNVLSLTYCRNTGGSWGIFSEHPAVLISATVLILAAATVYLVKKKPKSKAFRFGASLVYAGAVSNLADRIFRGFVVDMIKTDFVDFPIFNVADCCVVAGMILVCIFVLTEKE